MLALQDRWALRLPGSFSSLPELGLAQSLASKRSRRCLFCREVFSTVACAFACSRFNLSGANAANLNRPAGLAGLRHASEQRTPACASARVFFFFFLFFLVVCGLVSELSPPPRRGVRASLCPAGVVALSTLLAITGQPALGLVGALRSCGCPCHVQHFFARSECGGRSFR